MKKIVLSLVAVAASGALVWGQPGRGDAVDTLGSAASTGVMRPRNNDVSVPTRAVLFTNQPSAQERVGLLTSALPEAPLLPTSLPAAITLVAPETAALSRRPAAFADLPRAKHNPGRAVLVLAAMTVAAKGSYADGTFTGPVVDAYYGLIQIQAIVRGGRLMGIRVLKYPSDRQTSVYINRQALPMLQDEVVSAQSENVDIVSGATLTSEAFIMSLGAALREAH